MENLLENNLLILFCTCWLISRSITLLYIIIALVTDYDTIKDIIEHKKEIGTFYDDIGNIQSTIIKVITYISIYIVFFV